jgi:hypothetical protein
MSLTLRAREITLTSTLRVSPSTESQLSPVILLFVLISVIATTVCFGETPMWTHFFAANSIFKDRRLRRPCFRPQRFREHRVSWFWVPVGTYHGRPRHGHNFVAVCARFRAGRATTQSPARARVRDQSVPSPSTRYRSILLQWAVIADWSPPPLLSPDLP